MGEAAEDEMLGDVELPGVDDLPLFANEEAVVLHAEIKKQKATLEKAEKEHTEHAERCVVRGAACVCVSCGNSNSRAASGSYCDVPFRARAAG